MALLLVIFGTGWSTLIPLSVIDEEKPKFQLIQTDNQSSPQNSFKINPPTYTRSKSYKSSIETPKQDNFPPNLQIAQTLGDTRLFWVPDVSMPYPMDHYQINATLKIIGPHCQIYSNLSSSYDDELQEMNHTFETIIYPDITAFFGFPPDNDSNGKIIILAFDIDEVSGGYVAGFFYSLNQYLNADLKPNQRYSNEAEILHIDKLAVNDFETVAHEFQHMIHFGHDYDENIWLDEGASMFAEYLIGKDPFIGGPYKPAFQSNPDVSLTYWDSNPEGLAFANYGASYAFFLYLAEHFGGSNIIQNIVSNSENGILSVEQALMNKGYSVEFKEVFRNWTIANFLNDTSFANGTYGYYNISLSDMSVDDYYNAASAVPRTENSVPYWGTDYLEFTNWIDLPFALEFQGEITADFMVTAILENSTTPPLNTEVIPIKISIDEFGNFSTESLGISADQIVIAISAYTPSGKYDYSDDGPALGQDYWFMINPEGIIISAGNLTFSSEDSLYLWNIQVSDQNGVYWHEADGATYTILTDSGVPTEIIGNLTFNSESNFWESPSIDISSLPAGDITYRIKFHFFNSTYSGIAYSEPFTIIQDSSSQSSSSTPTVDTIPFSGFALVISILAISILFGNRKKK